MTIQAVKPTVSGEEEDQEENQNQICFEVYPGEKILFTHETRWQLCREITHKGKCSDFS